MPATSSISLRPADAEACPRYSSAMRERPALFLGLLADQPELIAEVGVLRWRAAGSVGTPGPWIESTARTAGREQLPLTLVAMGLAGEVIGAVTLGVADESLAGGCLERLPWVVDTVVRPGERLCGVGRLMVSALVDLAAEHGHDQLWVAADDAVVEFYRACGWGERDQGEDGATTVLHKSLAPA
jgi:GNAT superfamily N-acetyltransferase